MKNETIFHVNLSEIWKQILFLMEKDVSLATLPIDKNKTFGLEKFWNFFHRTYILFQLEILKQFLKVNFIFLFNEPRVALFRLK